jgi:opacity protein-like surface antigen
MRRPVFLLCLASVLAGLAGSLRAADAANTITATNKRFQVSLDGHVENFEWKEFDDDGSQFLKESGPLAGVGGLLDVDTGIGFHLQGIGEVFFGRIDYDGATQAGKPVDSKTKYSGFLAEADLMVPLKVTPRFYLKPYAGGGGRIWQREIEDSGEARGYEEYWSTIHGILGIGAAVKARPDTEWFGKAAVKMPIDNRVTYDFSDLGGPDDTQVEPGKKASSYFEAGIRFKNVTVAGYYEQMKFSKSDTADADGVLVFQPESEAKIIGLRAGVVF